MNFLHPLYDAFLDILFPRPTDVRDLEKLTADYIRNRASIAPDSDHVDIFSVLDYNNELVKKCIWNFKYKGNKKITQTLAQCMYEDIIEIVSELSLYDNFIDPIIIPIPLSKNRLQEKGFDQTALLTHSIAQLDHNNTFTYRKNILTKHRHTPPQTSLSRKERLHNLKDCFTVKKPEYIKDKNIILIDDVLTTGSTLKEAKKTLLTAGARRVVAFTLAH